MVSFQTPISPNKRRRFQELENSPKRRKWEGIEDEENLEKQSKVSKSENTKPVFDVDLHLGRPLPLEWQRCLDIQSGHIHFYNTRTQKRTCKDPRQNEESSSHSDHMSLDLELNLLPYADDIWNNKHNPTSPSHNSNDTHKNSSLEINNSLGLSRSPSLVSFEGDNNQEMVATVCMKCHMLVMLCKSSPSCPNCKFMHPPNQSPPSLSKPRFRLLQGLKPTILLNY